MSTLIEFDHYDVKSSYLLSINSNEKVDRESDK